MITFLLIQPKRGHDDVTQSIGKIFYPSKQLQLLYEIVNRSMTATVAVSAPLVSNYINKNKKLIQSYTLLYA
jgi:hypothetical protein